MSSPDLVDTDHLKAENRALRTCLQALLQERNVLVHCPDFPYRLIRDGFGEWADCVSRGDVRSASVILAAIRACREAGESPPAPDWTGIAPALEKEIEARVVKQIAGWVEDNAITEGLSAPGHIAQEIREGEWRNG